MLLIVLTSCVPLLNLQSIHSNLLWKAEGPVLEEAPNQKGVIYHDAWPQPLPSTPQHVL